MIAGAIITLATCPYNAGYEPHPLAALDRLSSGDDDRAPLSRMSVDRRFTSTTDATATDALGHAT
jgi:hypothetical protein